MRIGIITYATNHLKTEQIAIGLKQRNYENISLFALPFKPRPAREVLFAHRPDMMVGGHSRSVAKAIGADYLEVASAEEIPIEGIEIYLIGGAGILPPAFVNKTLGRVLNSHPGKIPLVRGLDALKWAILEKQPVENSLHFIDAETDAGDMVAQFPTPLFASDTMEKFAARHYEIEIDMMLDFEHHVGQYRAGNFKPAECTVGKARMRMKPEDQAKLPAAFEEYKELYAIKD
ncbi:phosphoribosylglycinamide formyltransferase-1 [Altererythrobacter xiamenensis]|uniref:Phosphoribosylglycinamide formyltransferase-1 n=1 Tax=Altererythrobacter xiamenensis TaxID=1316679 RepID=A0A1Y6F8L4_9SPHN|nr:formyltransferase family protein [Altererythrobacter xiamenensis]SMQ69062.1 phosphoribosylglycinamide formyltransferase-1 [Altererythrobacter xiamenensis]